MCRPDAGVTTHDSPVASPRVADGFVATLDLFATGLALMRQNLRRRHPRATDDTIDQLLRAWLRERPGAAAGDCPGRPVDLAVRRA